MKKKTLFLQLINEINEDFRIYFKADKSIKSRLGALIYALFEPGFYAVSLYRISHYLYKKKIPFFPLLVMRTNKLFNHVDISFECKIGKRLHLPHCCSIVIGATSVIGDDVEIMDNVTLGARYIRLKGKRHPTVCDGVFIGSGAKIIGNITIGEKAKIGANAVLLKTIPPNVTAVGVPAKIISKNDSKDNSQDKLE